MKILYMNNYRGFQQTYVPLTDVTFLLGENSSGKTSVLSLIQLLSKQEFWFTQTFNTEEISLGYFREMLSSQAKNAFFEVGLMQCEVLKEGIKAIYMKFVEDEGAPMLSEYRFLLGQQSIAIFKDKKKVQYTVETLSSTHTTSFKNWIDSFSNILPFKELEDITGKTLPFLPVLQKLILTELQVAPKLNVAAIPIFFPNMTWIAPIRAKPKRNYEGYKVNFSSEGEHIPYLLKSIFQNGGLPNASDLKKALSDFGAGSGLFEKIQVNPLGKGKTAAFEIQIVLNKMPLRITNVGYGVAQILPILVEVLAKKEATCFAIQQPEVHLHPKAQAMLGELFFHIAHQEQKSFIIETHSDFIVDRYRLALRKYNKKLKTKITNGQVLFFERTEYGNVIHALPIDVHGDYPENQPAAFRDFFVKEELDMLSY